MVSSVKCHTFVLLNDQPYLLCYSERKNQAFSNHKTLHHNNLSGIILRKQLDRIYTQCDIRIALVNGYIIPSKNTALAL
jgi:hypothetical protein